MNLCLKCIMIFFLAQVISTEEILTLYTQVLSYACFSLLKTLEPAPVAFADWFSFLSPFVLPDVEKSLKKNLTDPPIYLHHVTKIFKVINFIVITTCFTCGEAVAH